MYSSKSQVLQHDRRFQENKAQTTNDDSNFTVAIRPERQARTALLTHRLTTRPKDWLHPREESREYCRRPEEGGSRAAGRIFRRGLCRRCPVYHCLSNISKPPKEFLRPFCRMFLAQTRSGFTRSLGYSSGAWSIDLSYSRGGATGS